MNRASKFSLSAILGFISLTCIFYKGGGNLFQLIGSIVFAFGSVFIFNIAYTDERQKGRREKVRVVYNSSYAVALFIVWIMSSVVSTILLKPDFETAIALYLFGLINVIWLGGLIYLLLILPGWLIGSKVYYSFQAD